MLPITLVAATWGASWDRKHVTFSDNIALVAVIQCRLTGDSILLQLLLCLYFYMAYYHCTYMYIACHVSGSSNVAADALSHDYMSLFHSLIPQARKVEVTPAVLDLLVFRQMDWGSSDWITRFRASLHSLSPQLHSCPMLSSEPLPEFLQSAQRCVSFALCEMVLLQLVAFLSLEGLSYPSVRVYY